MVEDIHELLNQRTWTFIGVSDNTNKFGYKVYRQLLNSGYSVFAINPNLKSIEGDPCYPTLAALPKKPDAESIVVPPKITEQIITECIAQGKSNSNSRW